MNDSNHSMRGVASFFACLIAGFTICASTAIAQQAVHEIMWAHPDPTEVTEFVLLVSSAPGGGLAERRVELGKPTSNQVGPLAFFRTAVPLDATEYVSIVAIGGDGLEGKRSPWSSLPPTPPGQPIFIP